ncbi:beta-N-acetylhexosaminidase [Haloactinospora alba]|uniref:beta-N-acetylhexosaminidase n=1 Tax=Haloactinospora alba TaxID=405555 RepID=A0A543NNF1_9ACTN|nr:glycoside hydrolase family 3 protein [Haloactinospora alba]TQN33358.1 beta-N-acetylhexosaminidase [Haloactinospora alba]
MGRPRFVRPLATAAVSALTVTLVGAVSPTSAAAPAPPPAPSANETAIQQWAQRTTRGMSLEEKVGQLFVTYAYGRTADTAHPANREEFGVDTPAEVVEKYHLGGMIHFGWTDSLHEPQQIAQHSNGIQRAAMNSGAEIPLVIATDQEQGAVTRIGEPATQLPGSMALGAGRSTQDGKRAAEITGAELRAMGINQNFAPSGDVNVDPQNPVIGVRSFSSDPGLAARFTGAQVSGFQDARDLDRSVSAAVKHFPGHGDTNQDSHESLPVIDHTREQWEEIDAPPFREAIAQGTDTVMSAHIVMPELDDSGEPATLSPTVLDGMLREELGFDGVVVTDSLRMEGVRAKHPDAEIPVLALEAGADQMLMPPDLQLAIDSVMNAVREGRLTEERIDTSVERVLTMKAQRGIIRDPLVDTEAVGDRVGTDEHRSDAQRITDGTVNVLRNDAGLLPLREEPGDMLVTGAGDSATRTLAERIGERGPRTTALPTGSAPDQERIDRAVAAAGDHDVAVVLTNAAWTDGNAAQNDLVRALNESDTPVVAVPVRDPYDAAHVPEVETWVATYSDKKVSMESLARVLLGEVSPRGKLPVPVPDPQNPDEVAYPFGHGVSW